MPAFRDLTNHVFGRLTALRCVGRNKWGNALWDCICSCGNRVEIAGGALTWGNSASCGCFQRELAATRCGQTNANFQHGHRTATWTTPTYHSWTAMVGRCGTNPSSRDVEHYRGVTVCDRWRGEHGFEAFLEDMGERPAGTSLGRFGDVGNYEPGNCEWQTPKQQGAEQKIKRARLARQADDQVLEEIFGRQAA